MKLKSVKDLEKTIKLTGQLGEFLYGNDLDQAYKDNLKILLTEAKKFKLNWISLGDRDLMGIEKVTYNGWPCIWKLSENICPESGHCGTSSSDRFRAGCGNSDQSQINPGNFFKKDHYGFYNVNTGEQVSKIQVNLRGRLEGIKRLIDEGVIDRFDLPKETLKDIKKYVDEDF